MMVQTHRSQLLPQQAVAVAAVEHHRVWQEETVVLVGAVEHQAQAQVGQATRP